MDSSKAEHKMYQATLGYKLKIQTIIDDHGQELSCLELKFYFSKKQCTTFSR